MMVGFTVGITRMILDFSYPSPSCVDASSDTRPPIIKKLLFHYFYVALLLFALTAIVCVVVSLLTEPLDEELVSLYSVLWNFFLFIQHKDCFAQNSIFY